MARYQAIVSVGSNIEPVRNIDQAIEILRAEQELIGQSTMIQTRPVGLANQPDFINGALLVETDLDYDDFNRYLKNVESRLQRVREGQDFGPRTIDLDIVVWEQEVVHDDYYQYEHTRIPVGEIIDRYAIDISQDRRDK